MSPSSVSRRFEPADVLPLLPGQAPILILGPDRGSLLIAEVSKEEPTVGPGPDTRPNPSPFGREDLGAGNPPSRKFDHPAHDRSRPIRPFLPRTCRITIRSEAPRFFAG